MTLSDITLDHILFFLLGFLLVSAYYNNRVRKKVKEKYDKLKKDQIPFSEKNHKEVVSQLKKEYSKTNDNLKSQISKLKEKIEKTNLRYEKLKKYMGLVNNYEYGVLQITLKYAENKPLKVTCGFRTSQRGENKVRINIDINDIKTELSEFNDLNSRKKIKEMCDGWYDINSKKITWIKPDEATKREINIDNILDNNTEL